MVVLGCKLRARTLNPKPYYPKTRNPTTRLCASLGYKYVQGYRILPMSRADALCPLKVTVFGLKVQGQSRNPKTTSFWGLGLRD